MDNVYYPSDITEDAGEQHGWIQFHSLETSQWCIDLVVADPAWQHAAAKCRCRRMNWPRTATGWSSCCRLLSGVE